MNTFQEILAQKLAAALTAAGLPQAGAVTSASDPRFGDYQSNAALILAKQLGENPRAIAQPGHVIEGVERGTAPFLGESEG